MATKTLLTTWGDGDDMTAALMNSSLRRVMSIGTDWNHIRIAVRTHINDSGANVISSPRFVVGVCSGTTYPWNNGSATTTHFVGSTSNPVTWTREAANNRYTADNGHDYRECKRIGTTFTIGTGFGAGVVMRHYWNARTLFFVDIVKGSPNYSLRIFWNQTSTTDIDYATFISTCSVVTPSLTGYVLYSYVTLAVDEGVDGVLNTANVAWDRTDPSIKISDIAVVRFT